MALSSTFNSFMVMFIKSIAYLFAVQCLFLGPAYGVTLTCFMVYTFAEYTRQLLREVIKKATGFSPKVARRTVLINGCTQLAALHVARAFYACGFRVIACDVQQHWLNPTRFSVAVDDYFTVPKPENSVQEYVRALCEIVKKENVDVFVPVSTAEGAVFDALAKPQLERQGCECFTPTAEHVRKLGNKLTFFDHAAKCGFAVPLHFKVSSISEIMDLYETGIIAKHSPFILTSVRCHNKYKQDSVTMPLTIEEFMANIGEYDGYSCAILIQQKVVGRALTTSTTILEGHVIAHTACYGNHPFEYDAVQTANSLAWIQSFLKMYPTKLTGNFVFNFVVGKQNLKLYPESCVAGIGVASMNFQPERILGENMLTDIPYKVPVQPKFPKQVYCIYEEVFHLIRNVHISTLNNFLWKLCCGKEGVFTSWDPLPFIAFNHLHLPFLVLMSVFQKKGWNTIDFRSGRLQC